MRLSGPVVSRDGKAVDSETPVEPQDAACAVQSHRPAAAQSALWFYLAFQHTLSYMESTTDGLGGLYYFYYTRVSGLFHI